MLWGPVKINNDTRAPIAAIAATEIKTRGDTLIENFFDEVTKLSGFAKYCFSSLPGGSVAFALW